MSASPRVHFTPTQSRNALITLVVVLLALAAVIWLLREPVQMLYFGDRVTTKGLFLNGLILSLFVAGLMRIVGLLWHYRGEERAIADFLDHQHRDTERTEIDPDSLIARRYIAMMMSFKQGVTPNPAALAQIQVARESTRTAFPKFINNILILMGVFGTVVSLSIALFGTTNLLQNTGGNVEGINLIVHGMSTALSTTMTAIACYVVYGYFYLRLNHIQTRVISAVEEITHEYLVPRFRMKADSLTQETAALVESLHKVVKQLQHAQTEQQAREQAIQRAMQDHDRHMQELGNGLIRVQRILLKGFRLTDKAE